jgi:plasmid maintenance system antidote protein VapI
MTSNSTAAFHDSTGQFTRAFRRRVGFALAALVLVPHVGAAATLEAAPDEWDKLQACEQRVCTMILGKQATENVDCKVTKTWEKKTIKDGPSKDGVPTDQALKGDTPKPVSWGFGNAQCSAHLTLARSEIQSALTAAKHTINVPKQTVNCLVDRNGEIKPVTATLAPRIDFKAGQAHKVWINLTDMEGPSDVTSTVKTAAKLEDTLGLFHGSMIKSINKWMNQKCDEKYGPLAQAKAQKKQAAEARVKEREKKIKERQIKLAARIKKAEERKRALIAKDPTQQVPVQQAPATVAPTPTPSTAAPAP